MSGRWKILERCFTYVGAVEERGALDLLDLSLGCCVGRGYVLTFAHHHQHASSGGQNLVAVTFCAHVVDVGIHLVKTLYLHTLL